MHRRHLIQGLPALVGLLAATHQVASAAAAPSTGSDAALADAALKCLKFAEICSAHCIEMLEQGDRTLAECRRRVDETAAICEALASLAIQGSPVTRKLAVLAVDVCRSCEQECRKHEKQHAICKDCADSCVACARECKRIGA